MAYRVNFLIFPLLLDGGFFFQTCTFNMEFDVIIGALKWDF